MDIVREVAAVVFVLTLLGGVLWAMRRLPRTSSTRIRRLQAIERLVLTQHHALHLVRFGGQELVLSTHPQGCSVLVQKALDEIIPASADVAHASACSAGIRAGVPPVSQTGAGA